MNIPKKNIVSSVRALSLATLTAFGALPADAQARTDAEKKEDILGIITKVYNGGAIDPNGPEFQVKVSSDFMAKREFPNGRCVNVNVEPIARVIVNGEEKAALTVSYVAQFNYESDSTLRSMPPIFLSRLNKGLDNLAIARKEIDFWLTHVKGHGVETKEVFDAFRFARGFQGYKTPVTIGDIDPSIIQEAPWKPDPNRSEIPGVAPQFQGIECD